MNDMTILFLTLTLRLNETRVVLALSKQISSMKLMDFI